ncbi:MAG TPA: hypothetical protein VLG92_01420 [Candidatus Saccharimonadia bacterium]|nr:hypothetical protein [Candidatus Saccharimonadia bacterium]
MAIQSVEQLNSMHLPGYGDEASLEEVIPASGNVLTLLITSEHPDSGELEVLTSIRPEGGVYPWAISVATGMVRPADMQSIVDAKQGSEISRHEPIRIDKVPSDYEGELSRQRQIVRTYKPNIEVLSTVPTDEDSTLARLASELLARKFDVHEAAGIIVAQTLGCVSLHDVTVGLVGATGMESIEYNTSGLAVISLANRALIEGNGTATSGYQSNSWVSPEAFLDGYDSRDPERMHPGIKGASLAYVCTNGQCLRGAEAALRSAVDLEQHTSFA